MPVAAPYVARKGGARMLTRATAVELTAHGIAVNMIAPGLVTVPRNRALFLADPATSCVTGAEVVADCGMLAVLPGPDAAREAD